MNEFKKRRQQLASQLPLRSVALLVNPPTAHKTADEDYEFRPDSNMLYLTDLREASAVCLIFSQDYEQQFVAFVKKRDPQLEQWIGPSIGLDGVIEKLGADAAFPITELESQLETLLFSADKLYFDFRASKHIYPTIEKLIPKWRQRGRRASEGPRSFCDLFDLIAEMRKIKSPYEIEILKEATRISALAFSNAHEALRPELWEFEIQAIIEATFKKSGAIGPSFKTIVAGAERATTLHYADNNCKLNADELVLIDAGAEYNFYAGDISRTYPVYGKFTQAQAELYEMVLTAQKNAIKAAIPGNNIKSPHEEVRKTYAHMLNELGILKNSPEEIYDKNLDIKYYMHGTSHFLGMDTHDVGVAYHRGDDRPETLAPGMLITVEPGIYIPKDDLSVNERYRGIGIRIEDDILITNDGNLNLTQHLPKEIKDIEK